MKKRSDSRGNAIGALGHRVTGARATTFSSVSPVGFVSLPTVTGGRCSASRLFLSSRLTMSNAVQGKLVQAV